jgi:hypothetical protein
VIRDGALFRYGNTAADMCNEKITVVQFQGRYITRLGVPHCTRQMAEVRLRAASTMLRRSIRLRGTQHAHRKLLH